MFNFTWFSPAGLTRAQLPLTQRRATKPQAGEVPISPAWALLGHHGHLQVYTLRTQVRHREVFADGRRLEEREVRSLQLRCQVSATPGFKPSVSYPQASKVPSAWPSRLIWDLSGGYSSASPHLMQAGTSSAAVTQI